jgi:thiol-disulfide isomerase/thioredoxin
MSQMSEEKRQMSSWLIGLILAVVLFAIGLLVFNALGFGDDPVIGAGDSVTETADTDGLALSYFDGSVGSFEDLRGQPVVVNFWASWCPACIAEMPDLEKVHTTFEGEVQFVGANIQEVSRSDANALVIETGITYPLIEDPSGQLYAFFGGISMPTTVFIDAAGNIVDTHSGVIFKDDLEVKIREVFGL